MWTIEGPANLPAIWRCIMRHDTWRKTFSFFAFALALCLAFALSLAVGVGG